MICPVTGIACALNELLVPTMFPLSSKRSASSRSSATMPALSPDIAKLLWRVYGQWLRVRLDDVRRPLYAFISAAASRKSTLHRRDCVIKVVAAKFGDFWGSVCSGVANMKDCEKLKIAGGAARCCSETQRNIASGCGDGRRRVRDFVAEVEESVAQLENE